MKAIMLSTQPEQGAKILNGEKTIEVRSTCSKEFKHITPGENVEPIDVFIYVTRGEPYLYKSYEDNGGLAENGTLREWVEYGISNSLINECNCHKLNGKVVAKFTLKWCDKRSIAGLTHSLSDFNTFLKRAGIDWYKNSKEFHDYVSEKDYIYAWHISNLVIFDKPKELSEFYKIRCKDVDENNDCLYCNNNRQCPFAEIDYNPDDSINAYICGKPKKPLTRAPQSWQYIEVEE